MKKIEINDLDEISRSFREESNLALCLDRVAPILCEYLKVHRLFLIEIAGDSGGVLILKDQFEHAVDGVEKVHNNINLQKSDSPLVSNIYFDYFCAGKSYIARGEQVRQFGEGIIESYQQYKNKMTALCPVLVQGELVALLGVNDLDDERHEFEEEQKFLEFIARNVESKLEGMNYQSNLGSIDENTERLATLGKMTAGIVHEINNPMFVIYGYSSKIQQMLERNDLNEEKLDGYASMIQKNCKRINGIISGLQTLSRNSSRDDFEVTSLNNIVESTLDFSKERIRLGEIKLDVELSEDDLPIECKSGQIVQVLTNLLNNAYDSLEGQSGQRWIKIESESKDDRALVRVTDSGEPLSEDLREKLMAPFFTTKGQGKGTGLGLHISREILKRHDGRLFIDEDSNHVSFVVELPMLQYE
ncbi:ATP-binding protein [Halobacteriovorax sp. GB3]|uniref:ATP-binding protein n=1 Tax=Halobacteriovorax sp. GB3 TaxID=2719615 RepID=UPI0023606EA5|nr:ATP-binding protein [Halobacteriovorax sp. GB3]MDD0851986.1 ATP-binding protein [Halobacteriovorax sp. GB3]